MRHLRRLGGGGRRRGRVAQGRGRRRGIGSAEGRGTRRAIGKGRRFVRHWLAES
jgi:hypothetical protein